MMFFLHNFLFNNSVWNALVRVLLLDLYIDIIINRNLFKLFKQE